LVLGQFDLDLDNGLKAPTFSEYAKAFLETYSVLHHKQATIDSYKSVLDNHLKPVYGNKRLNEISRKDIKSFIIKKQNSGLAPNTVRIMRAYLSSVLTQAVDDEFIEINPASNTGRYIKKNETKQDTNPFTWEEKAIFEQEMLERFPRYYPLFVCALRTGMREGELIALKPGDIDFKGGCIEVKRNCVRGVISTPKTGRTRRVDMSAQLAEVLKSYHIYRKRETLKKGWKEPSEWLFYNEEGGIIDVANLRKRVFYKCLEKAKLRRIRLHDLRHTYATLRIQAGHNIADKAGKQAGRQIFIISIIDKPLAEIFQFGRF